MSSGIIAEQCDEPTILHDTLAAPDSADGDLLLRVFYHFMERLKAKGPSPEFGRYFRMMEVMALDEMARGAVCQYAFV